MNTVSASEALQRLQDGNARYVSGEALLHQSFNEERRSELTGGQSPFAIILGCSDSRVPAEVVFDQGLGDLFVVRVAGNIAADSQIGSIEFAAQQFGTRLVVVLGHSECGAVKAAIGNLNEPSDSLSAALQSILDQIQPAVRHLVEQPVADDPSRLLTNAIQTNVKACLQRLQTRSEVLKDLIDHHGLQIVGAEYSLKTGRVEFL